MWPVPDPNRENLERVALALGDLREELTFVGGAVMRGRERIVPVRGAASRTASCRRRRVGDTRSGS